MDVSRISFYIGAVAVCLVCLVYTLLQRRTDKLHNRLFLTLLVVVIVGAATDGTALMCNAFLPEQWAVGVVGASNYLYFLIHSTLAPLFFFYVLDVSGLRSRSSASQLLIYASLGILCFVLIAINPLTHWIYTYGDLFAFTRNWGVYLVYAISALYLFAGISIMLRFWGAITPNKRSSLLFFIALVVAATLVQMLVREARIELFGESLALLGLLLTIENDDDLVDGETGAYNRRALKIDLENLAGVGSRFDVVCVKVLKADIVSRVSGFGAYSDLMRSICSWVGTVAPRYRVYRSASHTFVVLCIGSEVEKSGDIASGVLERFSRSWSYLDKEVMCQACIMKVSVPEEISSPEDVFALIDSSVPQGGVGKVLSGADLDYFRRLGEVEMAVARGIEQGNFEVYYQPICDAEGVLCGAEALMRLNDPELGSVPPVEFIDVAERTGMIDWIGEFALQEACRFIASGEPGALGVSIIHVNLSVLQCMNPDFLQSLREIVTSNGVDPSCIDLEITETVAAMNKDVVADLMAELHADGFRFSMDDYGTGYSNMQAMLRLSFDSIKIDKSIVWGAEIDSLGLTVLENTMRMLHQTGHLTVAEGVETEAQIELLRSLGIDYLQGFSFSQPLPRDEFVAWARERKERVA